MKVAVCIPYIPSPCPWRARALHFVQMHWRNFDVDMRVGTHEGKPPNRAAARNAAARGSDADVFVFADADTWIRAEQFWVMVDLAAQMDRLVHGYVTHWHLTKSATMRTLDGEFTRKGEALTNQPSGVIAVSRALLEEVGGHDERFLGWGGEDRAFELACRALAGPGPRVPGDSYHLWHPKDAAKGRKTQQRSANQTLALRYKAAAGVAAKMGPMLPRTDGRQPDPDAMRALLAEPGGPLSAQICLR